MAYAPAHTFDSLPMGLDPEPDESVGSYCLRSLSAHGLGMHWLRKTLGLTYSAHPTQEHWVELAHLLQASPDWLRARLPSKLESSSSSWSYCGHDLRANCFLRFRHPQVCVSCVHLRGCCLALWDFSFVTACPFHKRLLIDHCSHCGKSLGWDRPAVDVCRCGRVLTSRGNISSSAACHAVGAAIAAHLRNERPTASLFSDVGMPSFLAELSLGGLMGVVLAFGEISKPNEWVAPSAIVRGHTTEQWAAIIDRAGDRLRQLDESHQQAADLSPVVSATLLRRVLRYSLSVSDLQVARLLYSRLFGPPFRRSSPIEGQLELFE